MSYTNSLHTVSNDLGIIRIQEEMNNPKKVALWLSMTVVSGIAYIAFSSLGSFFGSLCLNAALVSPVTPIAVLGGIVGITILVASIAIGLACAMFGIYASTLAARSIYNMYRDARLSLK